MTVVESFHADHGAVFEEQAGRQLPRHYGRPERTHLAVRNGVGVTEMRYGVLAITGEDRVEYVDNAVSNRVPNEDGQGCYALLCDPQGRIERDLYVYNAGERLLVFTPPDHAESLAEGWREKTFIQDVDIDVVTADLGVFGVHGSNATEKIASVLNNASAPDGQLVFTRGTIHDAGVTVIAGDDLTGEEGYEVVCGANDAEVVLDTLVNHGLNAVPFGTRTWETLTLEAGTPLFKTELEGRIPNVLGLRNAVDFEKGCFLGQEVISRVENRGQPSGRLVGLRCETVPEPGTAVVAGNGSVGEVTRATEGPVLEAPIALAVVEFDLDTDDLAVEIEGEKSPASTVGLPFVEGSGRSARLPTYLNSQ